MTDYEGRKLFGTDGIRGLANKFPMTPDIIQKVGQALGYLLKKKPPRNREPKIVLGKDTRLSGYMVERALTSGLNSMGVHVILLGPLPTPGIGFLTRDMRADAGIEVSASHNGYHDNGIKIFGHDGFKISDSLEMEIEDLVLKNNLNQFLAKADEIGRSKRIEDSQGRYVVHVKNTFPLQHTLEGLRIVLDCANGAGYKVAPAIFEELGAEVIVIGNKPNGFNINDKVGALYPSRVRESVIKYRADIGISLDGDADRSVLVDEKGRVVDGDHILCLCAIHLKTKGKLTNNTVVATQMSNFGLDKVLEKHGINVVRTSVGDKNVVKEMREHGYVLGGEQSGHIIFLEHSTTGDGCVAALNVLSVMKETGKKASELSDVMEKMPQVLLNSKVKRRIPFDQIEGYEDLIVEVNKKLKGAGRTFVRYSGTEDLIRVLVEGNNKAEITSYADEINTFLVDKLN